MFNIQLSYVWRQYGYTESKVWREKWEFNYKISAFWTTKHSECVESCICDYPCSDRCTGMLYIYAFLI